VIWVLLMLGLLPIGLGDRERDFRGLADFSRDTGTGESRLARARGDRERLILDDMAPKNRSVGLNLPSGLDVGEAMTVAWR